MIVRRIVICALLVGFICVAGVPSSVAQLGAPCRDSAPPKSSLGMRANFTVRDFQPRIDRTGPMNWIARNPTNVSEVFASSISGGLWRSTDFGNNWTPVRSLKPWSVSAVAYLFDGTPGGAVLVTTREDFRLTSGAGVWRSDDRGESWTQVAQVPNTCIDVPRAHGIAVHGTNVYVATSCGVLQSSDGRRFRKLDVLVFPSAFAASPIKEHFYSVEVNNSGDVLLGGEAGLFFRFRPAAARPRSGMFGNNGAYRRAFAVTPSLRYPNFILAVAGPQTEASLAFPPLQISQDSGQTWTSIPSVHPVGGGAGGSPFLRIFPVRPGSADLFVYYGDTYALYRAGPFLGGDLSRLATDPGIRWNPITLGHPDVHDIDFKSLPGEPLDYRALLLATDGGLEICNFGTSAEGPPTCSDPQILDTSSGLSSIQVMSLKGQIIGTGESTVRRLYFDTWHTDKFASPDDGETWTRIPGEAALLEMERRVPLMSDAQIVYNYNSTPNTLSDDLMVNGVNFRDATGAISAPIMLDKGVYTETVASPEITSMAASVNVTRSNVGSTSWVSVSNLPSCSSPPCFPLSITEQPIFAGYLGPGKTNPLVYQPYAGGLVVVQGFLRPSRRGGSVLTTGLATLARMRWESPSGPLQVKQGIAWTPFTGFGTLTVIGADPSFPSHLVIPDLRNSRVMRSLNGGDCWTPIVDLSYAVMEDSAGIRRFGFNIDRGGFGTQTLVSSISFFPDNPDLVILGTVENGLFFSTDRATTWQRIPNTEHITNVVALYWRSANSVIVGSFGRGLFEIRMGYSLPRSSLGVLCGDCRFLPTAPRVARIDSPRIMTASLQSADLKQPDFDEAVLVLDGRINGAEVNQGELQKLWVTIGSNEYRLSGPNSNMKFETAERSGYVGFKGLPGADQLRAQGQVIKGMGITKGVITHLIYGSTESPHPAPPSLGPIQLPRETNPQFKDPYLRIFGPGVVLGTMSGGKPFDLQGHLFRPDMPLELRLDGKAIGGQLHTDKTGRFETRLTAPSAIGPHEMVARQLIGNGTVQAAIGFSVNNSDEKQETSTSKRESPNEKKESVNEKHDAVDVKKDPNEKRDVLDVKRDPNQKEPRPAKDEKKDGVPVLIPLPILFTAADLIGTAKVSGGKIQLISMASTKSPEAKAIDWTGMSSGNELTLRFDLPAQLSVNLYAAFLYGPQAGYVRVFVNGQEIGRPLELSYSYEVMGKINVGPVDFRRGTNTVRIVVTAPQKGSLSRIALQELSIEK